MAAARSALGDVATFSFFGNKTVTTGEGGMVIAPDDELGRPPAHSSRARADPDARYWHADWASTTG